MTIRDIIELAGYSEIVQDQVAETSFMQGLHPELALAIRSSPMILNLEQKVDYAHRYWIARHPGDMPSAYRFEPKEQRREQEHEEKGYVRSSLIKPAQANWNRKKEDPAMEELVKKMERMEAHIADLSRNKPYRAPQAFQAESNRYLPRNEPWRRPDADRFLRCHRCGEEGHFARECQTETGRRAGPSMRSQDARNDTRRNGANMAQPEVTFREVFEDSDDEPDIAYYPAIHNKKVGRPPGSGKNQKRPYEKKGESSKITEPVTIYKAPGFDEVDELEEEDTQDVRMSESPSRENAAKKYRRSRKDPNYNAWEDIKTRTVQMTFEQAAELNPTVKQQIRNGLSEIKREYKVVEINSAQSRLQEDESSSEEEEDTRKTSAYAIGTIENVPVEYIIDIGAGG